MIRRWLVFNLRKWGKWCFHPPVRCVCHCGAPSTGTARTPGRGRDQHCWWMCCCHGGQGPQRKHCSLWILCQKGRVEEMGRKWWLARKASWDWGRNAFWGEPESGICWALMWAHPILEVEGGGDCRSPALGPGFPSYRPTGAQALACTACGGRSAGWQQISVAFSLPAAAFVFISPPSITSPPFSPFLILF